MQGENLGRSSLDETGTYGAPTPIMEEVSQKKGVNVAEGIDRRNSLNLLQEYEVNIEFLSVGCTIRVGCKKIAFNSIEEGMKALNEYVTNPLATKEAWYIKMNQ